MIDKNRVYGKVTRLPKNDNEMSWTTRGYDGVNPEGSFLYEFNDEAGWTQLIKTRLDLEFFKDRSNDYRVEVAAGTESRPKRPTREEPKIESPKVEAVKVEIPVKAGIEPKDETTFPAKRMGRPPKEKVEIGA